MAKQPDFLSTGPRPIPNRPVKPRKAASLDKPIMAIDREQVLLENGEIYPFEELPSLIISQPSSIMVAPHFGPVIKYLDNYYSDNERWQFRASPIERSAWAPGRNRQATMRDCLIGYLGFKGENKKKGHYHYPLSPQTFILKSISELRKGISGERATIVKLMEWAKEVRQFLQDNELNLSPTSGGIAAQLLKDKRFYSAPRRKVPRRINAKARDLLPGNFYKLYEATEGTKSYSAAYLDQISAHHTHAKVIEFPCANDLRARGRYHTLQDRAFAKAGSKKFEKLIAQSGLFYLAVEIPRFFKTDFPLPCLENKQGYQRVYVYSNELSYLKELGVTIRHIIACWTSPNSETGLNKYAEWALDEISKSTEVSKPWLKPTLLSTYGVLAAKPKIMEFGYRQAVGGVPKKYPCGSGFLDVKAKAAKKPREPVMANVIHRGMIEAQTRLESLRLARELAKDGHTILAIYADSIFVEDGKPLPLLKPPWRIQNYLTRLRFDSATHFTSAQLDKMPGIPLNARNRPNRIPPRPSRKKLAT